MKRIQLLAAVLVAFSIGYAIPRSDEPRFGGAPAERSLRSYQAPPPQASTPSPVSAQSTARLSVEYDDILKQATVFAKLKLAFEIAANSDQPQLERLAREALQQGDPLFRYNIANIFLEKMVAEDVERALSFAENLPESESRLQMISSVLSSWVRDDEDAAFAYFQSISNIELKQRIAAGFLGDKTRTEAFRQAVVEDLGAIGQRLARQIEENQLLPAEQFLAALESREPDSKRQLISAGMRWYRRDPEAALNEVASLQPSRQRSHLLSRMLSELVQNNPEQALDFMALHGAEDVEIQRAVLNGYASSDPVAALPMVISFTERTGDNDVLSTLLAGWVSIDPTAATEYAATLSPHLREQTSYGMVLNYVATRPREGLSWALGLDGDGTTVRHSAIYNLSPQAAEVAESMLDELPAGKARGALLSALTMHKSRRDPATTFSWLQQFAGEPGYENAYTQLVSQWGQQDPAAAAALITQNSSDAGSDLGYREIAYGWSRRDPERATNWALNLPDSEGREAALAAIVEMTARQDPEQAQALLSELSAGDRRDRAAATVAHQLGNGDPERMREAMEEMDVEQKSIDSYMMIWAQYR